MRNNYIITCLNKNITYKIQSCIVITYWSIIDILTLSIASSDEPDFISKCAISEWPKKAAKWSGIDLPYKMEILDLWSIYTFNDAF